MQRKILLVDDDERSRRILAQILEHHGYTVVESEDGEHAINTFREHKVDMIITDIQMPRKNGFEVFEGTRKEPEASVPCLFMSGCGDASILKQVESLRTENENVDFIGKPFDGNELLGSVRKLLN